MPTRDSYVHGTPNWVDLATSDVDASRSFYGELLGWDFADRPTDQGPPYVMGLIDDRPVAGMMQMSPEMQQSGMPSMWNTYIAVDDVAAATDAASGAGATVMVPPMQVMEHGSMSMVADPTGAPVGFWQAAAHVGAGVVNEPGAVTWNELQTQDVDAAAGFYSTVLGWGTQAMDMGDAGAYTVFAIGEDGVAGAMKPPMAEVPSHWSVVFAVDDADQAAARIGELGGTVHAPPFDTPVGRIAVGADPTGAVFQAIALTDPPA